MTDKTKKVNCILVVDIDRTHKFLAERAIQEAGIANAYHFESDPENALRFIQDYREKTGACPDMIFLDVNHPRETEPVLEFVKQYDLYDKWKRAKEGAIVLMVQNIHLARELSLHTAVKTMIPKPLNSKTILEHFRSAYLNSQPDKEE
jgi:hypothetical protein